MQLLMQKFLLVDQESMKRIAVGSLCIWRTSHYPPPSAHRYSHTHTATKLALRFRYSFICQGTSTRRQRSDLFGLQVKLPPVTTSL